MQEEEEEEEEEASFKIDILLPFYFKCLTGDVCY